jgi:hypothetical protein
MLQHPGKGYSFFAEGKTRRTKTLIEAIYSNLSGHGMRRRYIVRGPE